jgi:oligopeptide/dipeptide ABC transporter ATP-binding protein
MYLGRIVEVAETNVLFERPAHPYTRALLSAIPPAHPDAPRQRTRLKGDLPSILALPEGCRFASRCAYAQERCRAADPQLLDPGDGRLVACHRVADGSLDSPS